MAEESDLSRTEPASPQRLQQARHAGDVPRSPELTAWLVLLTALGMLSWQAPRLWAAWQGLLEMAWAQAARPDWPALQVAASAVMWSSLPLLVAIFAAALVAPMLLSGWVYAPQRSRPEFSRVSPFKPFMRWFSAEAWFDGALAALKLGLAVAAVAWALATGWPGLDALLTDAPAQSGLAAAAWVGRGLLALVAALALAAVFDAGWRWWRYLRRHAMTWQEVLAEARESETPPEVQARLRGRQQQAGQRINEVIG